MSDHSVTSVCQSQQSLFQLSLMAVTDCRLITAGYRGVASGRPPSTGMVAPVVGV